MRLRRGPSYKPKLAAWSKPRNPARQAVQTPWSSSGYALIKGVLQTAQKYSASSGTGDLRQASQTGTRVHSMSARLQMRQSSGKNSEKIPCGIPRTRLKAAVLAKA